MIGVLGRVVAEATAWIRSTDVSPKQEMICFYFTFRGYTAADLRHDARIEPATG